MKLYQNGLKFSDSLKMNLEILQERVDIKKSAMILIDGGLGEGKTTLMIHCLDYINQINGLPAINLDGPQLAMGGADFLKKMRECSEQRLPCIGYDEAGDFSRRGALTQFNRMLNRAFETFRAFNCIVILCLPQFCVLDQQLIDMNVPRLLLHLKNRTKRNGHYFGYSLYRIHLLKFRMAKYKIKNYAYTTVWPNIYGHFLDLEPERSKELDKISTKRKREILKTSEIKVEGLLTYSDMAKKLQRTLQWTRLATNELKIKHKRRIGNSKYFNEDDLNRLLEYSDKKHESPRGPQKRGVAT